MANAVFMGNDTGNMYDKIFNSNTKHTLSKHVEFLNTVIDSQNLMSMKSELKTVEYIFSSWGMLSLNEKEIAEFLPSLKAVFYAAGSVQYFARPFINSGVKVFSAWAANAVPVAEYTVAQIILANKGFYQASRKFKSDGFDVAHDYSQSFCGNFGAKIGILGAGMIGSMVIEMLKKYKFEVLVYDPFLSNEKAHELGAVKTDLSDIFSQCDVISNHIANNEKTKHILNRELFNKMKSNSTFINTGRGAQVVEADLVSVLKQSPDMTAILDVTFPEPPEKRHPFYTMDNVILTPHIAGSMCNEVARMGEYMCDEFIALTTNGITQYEVTAKMLATMA